MQHERVARCEVVVSHLAKFGDCRVRRPGVAPCDIFLIILGETEPGGKVDANVLEVSFTVLWIGKPKHPTIAPRPLSCMERVYKPVEPKSEAKGRQVSWCTSLETCDMMQQRIMLTYKRRIFDALLKDALGRDVLRAGFGPTPPNGVTLVLCSRFWYNVGNIWCVRLETVA